MSEEYINNRPRKARFRDTLRCNLGFLSWVLRGVLVPDTFFNRHFYKFNVDRFRTARLFKMRKRYGRTARFRLFVPPFNKKPIIIFDAKLAQSILQHDVRIVGESSLRTDRSNLWIDGAQTGLDGDEHSRIKQFSDKVLDTNGGIDGISSHLDSYLKIVDRTLESVQDKSHLGPNDFTYIGQEIATRIILGDSVDNKKAYSDLDVLLKLASSPLCPRKSQNKIDSLESQILKLLKQDSGNHTLVSLIKSCEIKSKTGAQKLTEKECLAQIKMWMFSLRDGLQLQPARVLTLILTHPNSYAKIVKELEGKDLSKPADLYGLTELISCIGETTRLWPTVEYFIREFKQDINIDGVSFKEGETVFMPVSFLQRDVQIYGTRTNTFEPESWYRDQLDNITQDSSKDSAAQCPFAGTGDRPFLAFSLGQKACPGQGLVTLLITALVARLLRDHHMRPLAADIAPNSFRKTQAHKPNKFEFIVVGSGAGGGPTACNLARAGHRVLLIEAGDDHSKNIKSRVPAYHASAVDDPDMSWPFSVSHFSDGLLNANDRKAEDDKIVYPRASTLGGCTTHNALVSILPPDSDWTKIANMTGDAGWRHERMRRYYDQICELRTDKGLFGVAVNFFTPMPFSKTSRFTKFRWLTLQQGSLRLAVGSE